MNALSELKPRRRDRIMDVVGAAGLDVSDWANSSKGASNPKYCYEWAFSDESRANIVLCLWHEELEQDADYSVIHRGNVRPLIHQLEGMGTPRARRARRFDELLQDAWRLGSTVRVAVVDRSDTSKRDHPELDVEHAAFRQLDPVAWRVVKYDMMTGEYILRREQRHAGGDSSSTEVEPSGFGHVDSVGLETSIATAGEGVAAQQMDYVCRIIHNDQGWNRPASSFKESPDSFASTMGFGLEEWLFRDEWTLGGWRYAFLQGVNDSYKRLCKEGTPFSVTLFTVDPRVGHRYVARMFGVEVLQPGDAKRALLEFQRRGWLDLMRAEVVAAGGRPEGLGDESLANHILNLRFRADRIERLEGMPIAMPDDPIRRIHRYALCSAESVGFLSATARHGGREPTTAAYFRNGTEPSWVTPEHGAIQEQLLRMLRAESSDADIRCEINGIDVLLETAQERVFFEVKSERCTRRVIREALGQVMEYAYYWPSGDSRKIRIVLVGRSPATESDLAYLDLLRSNFSIPVDYRQVAIDSLD